MHEHRNYIVEHYNTPMYHSSLFSPSQFIVIASAVKSTGLKYDDYVFPNWANIVGWGVAMSSMMFVPGYAIYKFCSVKGTFKQVSECVCVCVSALSNQGSLKNHFLK